MPYAGHIEKGMIVLDENASLPDGALVSVEVIAAGGGPARQGDSLGPVPDSLWGLLADAPEVCDAIDAVVAERYQEYVKE